MRPIDVLEERVKMKAFPFSLCDVTKDWLYLQPTVIIIWPETKRRFLEKNFPTSKNNCYKKENQWY